MEKENDAISQDAIFNRQIQIRQRKRGYRFSVDALLLAWYTSLLDGSRAAELGTGSGVISLALAWHRKELQIDAVEIQESLFELANQNIKLNNFLNITLHHLDLNHFPLQDNVGKYEIVYTNPPFRAVGQGRLNPDAEKAIARHELHASLLQTLQCCSRCLSNSGTATMIILAERFEDLNKDAGNAGLTIWQKTWIKPFPHKDANLLMVALRKQANGLSPDREISIWEEKGRYTQLLEKLLQGQWEGLPHPLEPG